MRLGKFTAVFLLIPFGLLIPSSAQTPAPDASAIIQQANVAMGCGIISKDTTIKVTGSITVASVPAPMAVTIDSKGNDSWRSALDTPKERKVTVITGGKGEIQHADGHITPLAQHNTFHQRPVHIPCLTNMALQPGLLTATYLRTEALGNDSCAVVALLPTNRSPIQKFANRMKTTVWISHSTGYLVKLQYINAAEEDYGDAQTVEIDYSDYRIISGLAVPFNQTTRDGDFTLDLVIDSVQLNVPAADFTLR